MQRVVDGDTLYLEDGRRIRMIGLNSPELGKRGRADEPFAVAARQRLEALVAASDGRVGVLPGKDDRDDYGRTLAHVYNAQGENLEERLIAEGLGFLVAVAPNVDLVSCQQVAERHARQAGSGLWKKIARRASGANQCARFRADERTCRKRAAQSRWHLD
nr:hypothetical protein GCM10020185_26450 [Pseudomonas brassicacearum subsp. brassicacearum]